MSLTVMSLVFAGALIAAWYSVTLGYALATRPRDLVPAPATMHLGAEPPAVVNLLVTRGALTAAAADATLLDLAARRIVEIFQPGDDPGALLIRVRGAAPAGLNAYEQRVFDRFADWSGDRFVPLREIAARYADGGPNWFRSLRADVIADARARGLLRTRQLGNLLILASVLAGMGLACAGVLPFQRSDNSGAADAIAWASVLGWFVLAPIIALLLIFLALAHVRTPRYTVAGRTAGAHWLGVAAWLDAHESLADLPPAAVAVWDRYLAYGVALGVNPVAEAALDLRVGHVAAFTSLHTGVPRTVIVRYPRNPFTYTQAGVRATWSAAVLAAWIGFAVLAAPHDHAWPQWLRALAIAVGGFLAARAAYRLIRSLFVKFTPTTVTGRVLAVHPWRPQADRGAQWIQVVLDDGRSERVWPWLVRADRVAATTAGDVVRIRAQRWTRYVLRLEKLSGSVLQSSLPNA